MLGFCVFCRVLYLFSLTLSNVMLVIGHCKWTPALYAGMVAEAMAVEVPSSKSALVPPKTKVKRNFWPFGRKTSAYRALKDVDAAVKRRGAQKAETDDATDDDPLVKAGVPTAAKYAEKLSRKNATDCEEPFVPRPNSRIKFKLPDKIPSEDTLPEVIPASTSQEPQQLSDMGTGEDEKVTAADPASETSTLIPALDGTSASDTAAADELKSLT